MLDFESARLKFAQSAALGDVEALPFTQAIGRVLAEPVLSSRPVPEFDTSAMDGYAVCTDDLTSGATSLPVQGEAPAGSPPGRLVPGTAMRIFTGAAVPAGGNAVIMQEHVTRDGQTINIHQPVRMGQNIRGRGEDLGERALALPRGSRLTLTALALVSFLDHATVRVTRAPRVAILCTGSELREPGSPRVPGSIAESNSPVLGALAAQAGAAIVKRTFVEDDRDRLQRAIEAACAEADVLLTVGGVSVGDYDYVRPVLESLGFVLELCQVAIKPGKPIVLGRRGTKVVVGLPGNPSSAVLTFALFGMPLLRAMQGDSSPHSVPTLVPVVSRIKRDPSKTRLVLGNLVVRTGEVAGGTWFEMHQNQSSGATIALGQSEGFAIVEPGPEPAEPGTSVRFHRFTDL